jgi:predicted metalloprotease
MKFGDEDRADGGQVEDRRGFPTGRVGGGLGVVGVVIVVAFKLLNGDTRGAAEVVLENAGKTPSSQESPQAPPTPLKPGSCAGVTSETDPAKFIVCVETNVQSFWAATLPQMNQAYRPAKLVLFTEQTESGCGQASAATGPFYCPADKKVYLDLGFFAELRRRFHARGGDFAEGYVVAHEYGHHVQDLLGIEAKMRLAERQNPAEKNALSVRLELQADCYAGVWGHAAYEKGKVSSEEIALALDAAAAVGDDRIQKEMRGSVRPETFTHGSAAMRQKWFRVGMEGGDPRACDTFREP